MSRISDSGFRWLTSMLTVLGGSVLLSACSPASPSAPDAVAALGEGEAGAGRVKAQMAGLLWCRPRNCNLIDPVDVTGGTDPRVQALLNITNVGDDKARTVHVTGTLLGADGRRIRVSDTDHPAPRPGETIDFIVEFVVPSTTPPGQYQVEMALYLESGEASGIWVSDQVITVASVGAAAQASR